MQCPSIDAGGEVRLYVNTDKNPKQRLLEITTRDLTRTLRTDYHLQAFPNKKDGTVTVDRVPIANVVCTTADAAPNIYWSAAGIKKIGNAELQVVATRRDIAEKVTQKKAEKVEWSL